MKLFRIKWELIMVIMYGLLTIISFSVYRTVCNDWRMLAITITAFICFIVLLITYNEIKEFRKQVEHLWK